MIKAPLVWLVLLTSVAHAKPLEWQRDFSKRELATTDAEKYCAARGAGWRLPVKRELASLLVDPGAQESALRDDAPALPPEGYLWSGEDVSDERKGQRWIMNLANGHIFNGDGYKGHAKCVRGDAATEPAVALPAGYAFLGPSDAKLTIIVAAQIDYFWFKVRPILDQLLAAYPVRFELHAYTTQDKYRPAALALCAAGRANKLAAFDKKLLEAGASKKLEAAALRALALDAGIDAKAYDESVAKDCPPIVAADQEALGKRGIDAVPAFVIGAKIVRGAQPYKTFAAAIEDALPR